MNKTKINVKGFFQNKQLADVSKVIANLEQNIEVIGFHMEFSYITNSKVDDKYLQNFEEFLLSNNWLEDLICLEVEEISMSRVKN